MKKLIFLFCVSMGFVFMVNAQQTPPQDTTFQEFTGKYKFPDGSVISEAMVALENGALTVTSSAGVSALEKQGEDLFTITQFQGTAKFNRDANRKIIGVSINAMGYQLEGTKSDSIAFTLGLKKKYVINGSLVNVQVR